MATSDPKNEAKLRDAYDQWNKTKGQSTATWMSLFADNVRLRSLAGGRPGVAFTNEVRSKGDMVKYFAGLLGDWEMIHYTTDEFIVDGDRIAMRGSTAWRHRKTGRELETRKADFVTFKGGKIVEFEEFYDTAGLLAALEPRDAPPKR
jgi:ketosteroid isomerase-like protein